VTRHFDDGYVERAALRDGTPVVLRLVTAEDREILRRGFERLSPQSRYARFFELKQRLSDDELRYLTDVDQETHVAIGAIYEAGDGDGNPVGVGIARFVRLARPAGEPVTAEPAIAVADDFHRRGLGHLLLARLSAAAVERGIERFRCEVACSNAAMKQLITDLAPTHSVEVSAGVMSIEVALPDAPVRVDTPAPRSLYDLLRAAAQGALQWTVAVKRLWRRD
jgi:GNAT superfamily N-acetyltransferase